MKLREEYSHIDDLMYVDNEHVYVLEDQIDIDLQTEYFKLSSKLKKNVNAEKAIKDYPFLFDENLSVKTKKQILSKLATVERVETFRLLESFKSTCCEELKDWATLAYNESKMLLESSLSDQKQVFISTGMGGRGEMLRYFMVLFPHEESGFSKFQQKFIVDEVKFTLQMSKAKLDAVQDVNNDYISFLVLIPIKKQLDRIINETFKSCNQFGKFLNDRFIITNVKSMEQHEIMQYITEAELNWESGLNLDYEEN